MNNTHQMIEMIEAFHRVSASGSGMISNRAGGLSVRSPRSITSTGSS
jgi:hypothetical protein